jgi:hypothetical protein
MAEKPPEMFRNNRARVDIDPAERLFRRVSPDDWGEPHPEVDALDIPDMSVNRGKPIGEPTWVLLESDEYAEWGIVFFVAGEIPPRMSHADGSEFTFQATHVPLDENYPHSEIWAYKDGERAQARRLFDRDLSLRWRNALLQRTRVYIRPGEADLE